MMSCPVYPVLSTVPPPPPPPPPPLSAAAGKVGGRKKGRFSLLGSTSKRRPKERPTSEECTTFIYLYKEKEGLLGESKEYRECTYVKFCGGKRSFALFKNYILNHKSEIIR